MRALGLHFAIMQRSTSFFWASDDFREHHGDDNDEDNDDLHLVNRSRIGISWSVEEEAEEEISDEEQGRGGSVHVPSSLERIALNQNVNNGYGSSSVAFASNHNDNVVVDDGISLVVPTAAAGTAGRRRLFNHLPQTNIRATDNANATQSNELYKGKDAFAPSLGNYGITSNHNNNEAMMIKKSIRFQVVIWHIGTIDVQTGHVKMRFRLTLFWNDDKKQQSTSPINHNNNNDVMDHDVWVMEGRQRAYRKKWNILHHHNNQQEQEGGGMMPSSISSNTVKEMIDVPPVSILNAVELEIVDDAPEIMMIDEHTRSMRWT